MTPSLLTFKLSSTAARISIRQKSPKSNNYFESTSTSLLRVTKSAIARGNNSTSTLEMLPRFVRNNDLYPATINRKSSRLIRTTCNKTLSGSATVPGLLILYVYPRRQVRYGPASTYAS
jgi:hypothetical protein